MNENLTIPGRPDRERTPPQSPVKGESTSLVSDQKSTGYDATPQRGDSDKTSGVTSYSGSDAAFSSYDSKDDSDTCTSCCKCCTCRISLLFCKGFYFCFMGAMGCIHPYVSIYMKQLGLSPQQIGLIFGLRPMIGFCSAPLWGALADKFNVRKIILLLSLVAWLSFFVGLFHIKSPTRVPTCPSDNAKPLRQVLPPRVLHEADALLDFYNVSLPAAELSDAELIYLIEFLTNTNESALDALLETTNRTERTAEEKSDMREYTGWLYESNSIWRVFVIVLSLIVSGEVAQSPASALSDAGTLQSMNEAGLGIEYYGSQRAWGSLGYGLSSFLAGAVVSTSRQKEIVCGVELYFSDYRLLTYVFIGFLVLAFVAATQIKFKEGKEEEKLELTGTDHKKQEPKSQTGNGKDHNAGAVVRIFLNVHYGSWLATSFFVGVCNGVIWGFLYWHLDNLGANQLLMGVSGTVLCVSEFIMFFLVGKIINVLGHMGIMYLGLLGYSVRFCVYAVIKNPWWVLPAEVLQGVTFSCVWVSMTAYTTLAVPAASLATIQGILHGVYFGLGSGSGHLIGGLLIGYFGAVITFFSFAAASIVVLLLFVIAQKCSTKPDLEFDYKDLDEERESARSEVPGDTWQQQ